MSKFKLFQITIFVVLLISLVLPRIASAALVPCGRSCVKWNDARNACLIAGHCTTWNETGTECVKWVEDVPLEEAQPCNLCHVFKLMQRFTNGIGIFALGWMALFTVLGGIIILTAAGAPERVSQGKRMITYSLIGVIIAFGAWIIINTTMNAFVKEPGQPGAIPWPWNKIQCVPSVPTEIPPSTEKNYCVCQEPYTARGSYTLIKATALSDAATCNTECVFKNRGKYCSIAATSANNLKCLSGSELNNTDARCLKRAYTYERIGQTCYSTDLECANSISTYSRCDDADCKCYDSDDLSGVTFPCQTNQFAIFRKTEDMSKYDIGFCGNVLTCQQHLESYGTSCWWCALGSAGCEEEQPQPTTNWRFQGDLEGTKDKQIADAAATLTNFLNCFYQKAPNNIGYISAITDKDIYNGTCNPQDCKTSTCTTANCGKGKPCDHNCHSCHYGGTCTTTKSYAVDFGDEGSVCAIADAAKQCGGVNRIYGPQTCGGNVTDDNQHEDHVHISVTNSCGCN